MGIKPYLNQVSLDIFPRIYLYTLSFSKAENIIIKDYLENTFGIKTKLKYRKYGKRTILEINKKVDVINFINIVKPYVSEITCMNYKIDLEIRFEEKRFSLKEDELFILKSKKNEISTKEIAKTLNPPYFGVVDKLRRMKKAENLR